MKEAIRQRFVEDFSLVECDSCGTAKEVYRYQYDHHIYCKKCALKQVEQDMENE